jgi:hypothetical protein
MRPSIEPTRPFPGVVYIALIACRFVLLENPQLLPAPGASRGDPARDDCSDAPVRPVIRSANSDRGGIVHGEA